MWRKQNSHTLLAGMQNGATILKNNFSASKNVKQRPSNFPPRGNENMYLYKHLYMSIHSSIINNNHKVETTRVPLGRESHGSLVVRIRCFHCRCPGLIPGQGQAAQCGQKLNLKNKTLAHIRSTAHKSHEVDICPCKKSSLLAT